MMNSDNREDRMTRFAPLTRLLACGVLCLAALAGQV